MLEVVIVKSYILYSTHSDVRQKLSYKDFRRELVLALCEEQHLSGSLDDGGKTRLWSSYVGHSTLTLGPYVAIAACAVSRVQEVNGISPLHCVVHVVTIPTCALGNASGSITHKPTCLYFTHTLCVK